MSDRNRLLRLMRLVEGTGLEEILPAIALGAIAGSVEAMRELPRYAALRGVLDQVREVLHEEAVAPVVLVEGVVGEC